MDVVLLGKTPRHPSTVQMMADLLVHYRCIGSVRPPTRPAAVNQIQRWRMADTVHLVPIIFSGFFGLGYVVRCG